MCQVLKVNRSYYYAVSNRLINAESDRDKKLKEVLKKVFNEHRENYGQRRLKIELKTFGFDVGGRRL